MIDNPKQDQLSYSSTITKTPDGNFVARADLNGTVIEVTGGSLTDANARLQVAIGEAQMRSKINKWS